MKNMKKIKQKLVRTEGSSQHDVNKYLDGGWTVKEFKPVTLSLGGSLSGTAETFCYVLLQKTYESKDEKA